MPNKFHDDDLKNALCELLLEQAQKCQSAMGSALLLSIKNHIEGQVRWEGMSELWEVADHYAKMGNVNVEPDAVARVDA